jgi:hypothetical protein
MRQTVSNACFDSEHDDCGLYAPDGKPCACACHKQGQCYLERQLQQAERERASRPEAGDIPSSQR